jgi:hypothetical protein
MPELPSRDGPTILVQLLDTLRRAVGDAMEHPPKATEEDRVEAAYAALLRFSCGVPGLGPPPDPVPPPGERPPVMSVEEWWAWKRALDRWQVEAEVRVGRPEGGDGVTAKRGGRPKKGQPRLNLRLLDLYGRKPETVPWGATKLAEALGCARSSIQGCDAFKEAADSRAAARAEKQVKKARRRR